MVDKRLDASCPHRQCSWQGRGRGSFRGRFFASLAVAYNNLRFKASLSSGSKSGVLPACHRWRPGAGRSPCRHMRCCRGHAGSHYQCTRHPPIRSTRRRGRHALFVGGVVRKCGKVMGHTKPARAPQPVKSHTLVSRGGRQCDLDSGCSTTCSLRSSCRITYSCIAEMWHRYAQKTNLCLAVETNLSHLALALTR